MLPYSEKRSPVCGVLRTWYLLTCARTFQLKLICFTHVTAETIGCNALDVFNCVSCTLTHRTIRFCFLSTWFSVRQESERRRQTTVYRICGEITPYPQAGAPRLQVPATSQEIQDIGCFLDSPKCGPHFTHVRHDDDNVDGCDECVVGRPQAKHFSNDTDIVHHHIQLFLHGL